MSISARSRSSRTASFARPVGSRRSRSGWSCLPRAWARTLARLLAAGSLDAVWMPDRGTWVMRRRLSRRGRLVSARSRAKNQIHAVLMRQLVGRPPVSDLFGVKGRRWLAGLELALEGRETVDGCMRQIEVLDT